jgi:uncharacterized membrane protein YkvA (DUF1232 family)
MATRRRILAKGWSWRERARRLKTEMLALSLAVRHPGTPWYAKLVVAGAVAYAVTPVDFFPDALPILGLVDDLIFVPLALGLAVRFVPAPVLADCRHRATEIVLPRAGSLVLVGAWIVLTAIGVAAAL